MADKESPTKGITPDWLVQGVLTKVGDMFDRLTGRGWKPPSSLATSELIERMKTLLDSEARDERSGCKFVPNNIKLKMQWDKFSTDSEDGLRKLETELLTAAVDHINDRRYFTHAPLVIEVKPDYFTPGVRLQVSFDKFENDERDASVHLSVPGGQEENIHASIQPHKAEREFSASFSINGMPHQRTLILVKGMRLSVGRTKENDLCIDDPSVSKIHASLTVDDAGKLVIADTGSTNGTFIAGERIAYGKAVILGDNGPARFGVVEVSFNAKHIPRPDEGLNIPIEPAAPEDADLDNTTRIETAAPFTQMAGDPNEFTPAPTAPAFALDEPAPTEPAIDLAVDEGERSQ